MKKNLILLFILCSHSIYSQVIDTSTYAKKRDYLLQNIVKPSNNGILYDRACPFAQLTRFGVTDYNVSSSTHWKQAYFELKNASGEKNFDNLSQVLLARKAIGIIPIGVIDTNINYLDTLLVSQKTPNTPFVQIKEGKAIKTKNLFIGAILNDHTFEQNKNYVFSFSKEFYFQNNEKQVNNIEIAFIDEARNYSFTPYDSKTINLAFKKLGTQRISFKISYRDGTSAKTFAEIAVEDANLRVAINIPPCYTPTATNANLSIKANITATIPFTGYEATDAPILGMGEVGYYYAIGKSCDNQKKPLTKPIIILDGFDPLDKRPIGEIYGENLSYNFDVDNLGRSLRDLDYDVVVLNFPLYISPAGGVDGGADYVERNAMVLIKLIQDTNAELSANGSTEKLVIVGPSMGGLISRYALAYMEKNNLNHNTRLWVSFDSPHNGATIPIGTQKMLYKAGDILDAAKNQLNSKLGSVAARQMLLMHYTNAFDKENWYRNIFKTNLTNNGLAGSDGFPKNLRKIALINGQLQGTEKYVGASGDYLRINFKKKKITYFLGIFIPIISFIPTAEINCYFASGYNNSSMVHRTDLSFLGFIGLQAGNSNAFAYDGFGSIDKAPGGHYDSSQEVLDGFVSAYKSSNFVDWVRINGNVSYPDLCFIPTKSALAYKGSNTSFYENLSGRNLMCTNETPFDNYFAPSVDEKHTSISVNSAGWLFNELRGVWNLPNPSPTNYSAVITTPASDLICTTSTFNLTLDPAVASDPTTIITWSASPANLVGVLSGQNTNTATISRTSLNSGFTTISASISFSTPGCKGAKTVDFSTWVGSPKPPILSKFYPKVSYCIGLGNLPILPFGFTSSVTAIFTNLNNVVSEVILPIAPDGSVNFVGYGTYVITSCSNICGTFIFPNVISFIVEEDITCLVKQVTASKPTNEPTINIFPNPSSGQVTIENILAGSKVTIYDNLGRVMFTSAASEGNGTNIDISSLKTGIYILEAILPNNQKVRKNIVRE